jgi:hypothetical protein
VLVCAVVLADGEGFFAAIAGACELAAGNVVLSVLVSVAREIAPETSATPATADSLNQNRFMQKSRTPNRH